ncbi:MAG: thioredoxin domain-containing protein [Acidobacteriota bacterium]|nr:thioredoxin domain-containing protein [Acidobacteriota bacterium]
MKARRDSSLLRVVAPALAALAFLPACAEGGRASEAKMFQGRNHLGSEKSPYLLQHKDNPVWWHAWGEEAFAEARSRKVPIFLSVGYSTCHWCHVMERECFEDEEVADFLNRHFVAIKVDREERPDIDAIYMSAVHAMGQRGGWPMSVFLTPEGKPFFGGTYFPKPRFLALLSQIRQAWDEKREAIVADAGKLTDHIEKAERRERAGDLDERLFWTFLEAMKSEFDPVNGGSRGAPKFPASDDLRLLLRIHRRAGDESALQMVRKTLDAMAAGGIYDHLGGGFSRYSTDAYWLIPHFEKMLYDQASLVQAYLDAWEVTGDQEYELVVRETLDYVLRALHHDEGGFYSAEDADSEGEEGKFYVWTRDELRRIVGDEAFAELEQNFAISEHGNFEHGTNVLSLKDGHRRTGRSESLKASLRKLFEVREKRVHPHLDDKILTDWNGLMIAAMARAGRELNDARYIEQAVRAMNFILTHSRDAEGGLLHRYRDGQADIRGFLEDYAYMVDALIELYQADFDPRWLKTAVDLSTRQEKLFAASTGDYFTTDGKDRTVLIRKGEQTDNVRPAGRSVAARNLLRLADLMVDPKFGKRAAAVFASTPRFIGRAPQAFSHLLLALDYATDASKEVAVIAPRDAAATRTLVRRLEQGFQPNMVLAVGPEGSPEVPLLAGRTAHDGRPTIYVCENHVCQAPTTDIDQAARTIHTMRRLRRSKP